MDDRLLASAGDGYEVRGGFARRRVGGAPIDGDAFCVVAVPLVNGAAHRGAVERRVVGSVGSVVLISCRVDRPRDVGSGVD